MTEYFIIANSFAAPFFSDTSNGYVLADTPQNALLKFIKKYKHPAGLFAAIVFNNADDYHKNKPHLVRWMSNAAKYGQTIKNPKDGSFD